MAPVDVAIALVSPQGECGEKTRVISHVEYDAASFTFRIPVLLLLTKGLFKLTGFRSAAGLFTEPVSSNTSIGYGACSRGKDRIAVGSQDPRLLNCWKRSSGSARKFIGVRARSIPILQSGRWVDDTTVFTRDQLQMAGAGSILRRRLANHVVVQRIPNWCDGQNWWWDYESPRRSKLEICSTNSWTESIVLSVIRSDWTSIATAAATQLGLRMSHVGTQRH